MKLRKVISGGQTGADWTGLVCARALGLQTGGTAPKGWRTDDGPNPELGSVYGLVEHSSSHYGPRTYANAAEGEVTLWFGDPTSPGGRLTAEACRKFGRRFIINPDEIDIRGVVLVVEVINIAGNRARTNPDVIQAVIEAFEVIKVVQAEGT